MGQFDNKVAIVTGSGGGIGQAYAEALARQGAVVVVADINTEGAQKVADGIKGEGGTALAVRVDVADPDSAKEMAAQTLSEFGGIDYLVNNAAIFGGMKLDFLITVDWDYYKKFMSVNMDGALVCTRAVYRKMAKRGGGAIVNQSSTAAWLYSNFYGLAKVGINGLTQQLATELGGQNIRVNAIAPGPIDTEANRSTTPQEMVADIVKGIPLSRVGTPKVSLVGPAEVRRLQAIVAAVDKHLSVEVVGNDAEWTARVVETETAAKEFDEVAVAKVSGGATFVFEPRKSLPLTVV